MIDPLAYQIAARDQAIAALRNQAAWLGDVLDAYIRAGFSRDEAYGLAQMHLASVLNMVLDDDV